MINLLIGAVAGFAGGYVVKGRSSNTENVSQSGKPYSALYNEAQEEISKLKSELRNRNSEMDDLNLKVKNLSRKLRENEDKDDDRSDIIDDLKRHNESLRRQNEDLQEKMNDYKSLYIAAQQDIERLKG